jgi:hypothetical protein
MRRTSPATVYVISSSGELLRTLKIEPADTGQMPIDMQVAKGTHCGGVQPVFLGGWIRGHEFHRLGCDDRPEAV